VSYSLNPDPLKATMDAFNGVGILLYLFASNIMLEIQATIAPDPKRGGDTSKKMQRGVCISHLACIGPINLVVGTLGFWALGSGAPVLLSQSKDEILYRLQAVAVLFALLQQNASVQLYLLPPLHALEGWLAAACAKRKRWLGWLVLPPLEEEPHERATTRLGRARSAARHLTRVLSTAMSGPSGQLPAAAAALKQSPSLKAAAEDAHVGARASGGVSIGRALSIALRGPAPELFLDDDLFAADDDDGSLDGAVDVPDAESGRPRERPHPSPLLMFLVRALVMGVAVLISVAAPFVGSFVGLLGGLGYGPLSYPLFTVLYLMARGHEVPKWEHVAGWLFVAVTLVACVCATVGSFYSLVQNIGSFHFLEAAAPA